ncbi:MAG: peptidase dimerization protein, partial [Cyanobacteriota bacterium]
MIESFKEIANSLKSDIIEFTQKLIQTPSLTGNEEHIAEIVFHKMKSLGYDDVFIDDCGNVVGILKGEEKDKDIVFSSHLDHGEPEEKSLWEYDPYSGNFDNEFIYGIGSSDCKASIASQIYSGYILKKLGLSENEIEIYFYL